MDSPGAAPTSFQVIRAITRRDLAIGSRRRLVRLLFLASILPPLVLTVIIVVRMMAETATGYDLDWDPVLEFLQFQTLPVAFLALALGTPGVARDRAEDVLFLYATRPVLPWHYALGKMLAVALPAAALMLLPGTLIAILRVGVTRQLETGPAIVMVIKLAVASIAMGWAYAGVSVGPSAATKRGRWALLIALGFFIVPDGLGKLVWGWDALPLGPKRSVDALLETIFDRIDLLGLFGFFVLMLYGGIGLLMTTLRVRKEMIP